MEGAPRTTRMALWVLAIALAVVECRGHIALAMGAGQSDQATKGGSTYAGSGSFSSSNSASFASSNSGSYSFSGAGAVPVAPGFGHAASALAGADAGAQSGTHGGVGGLFSAGLGHMGLTGSIGMFHLGTGTATTGSAAQTHTVAAKTDSNTDASGHHVGIHFGIGTHHSGSLDHGTAGHGTHVKEVSKKTPPSKITSALDTSVDGDNRYEHKTQTEPVKGLASFGVTHHTGSGYEGKVDSYGNPVTQTNIYVSHGAEKHPETEGTLTIGSGSHLNTNTETSFKTVDAHKPSTGSATVGFGLSHAGATSGSESHNTQHNVQVTSQEKHNTNHGVGFGIHMVTHSQPASHSYTGSFGGAPGILGEQKKPGYAVVAGSTQGASTTVTHEVQPEVPTGFAVGMQTHTNADQQKHEGTTGFGVGVHNLHGTHTNVNQQKHDGSIGLTVGMHNTQGTHTNVDHQQKQEGSTEFGVGVHNIHGTHINVDHQQKHEGTTGFGIGVHNAHGTHTNVDHQQKHEGTTGFGIGVHNVQGTHTNVDHQQKHEGTTGFGIGVHNVQGTHTNIDQQKHDGSTGMTFGIHAMTHGTHTNHEVKPTASAGVNTGVYATGAGGQHSNTHYMGGFGGAPGVLGEQHKPGYAVGLHVGGSGTGANAGSVSTVHTTTTTHNIQSGSHNYAGGFGGAPGILGMQAKPGFGVTGGSTTIGAHPGVVVTMTTQPHHAVTTTNVHKHESNYGHYEGSFGGAPGIITATGPAPNYFSPVKGGSGVTVHMHHQTGPSTTVSTHKVEHQGSVASATSGAGSLHVGGGHHYTGSYGGAPGIITATGPAPNHPYGGGAVTVTIKPATHGFVANHGASTGVGGTHVVIGGMPVVHHGVGISTGTGVHSKPGGVYGGVGFGGNHGFATSGAGASSGSFTSAGTYGAGSDYAHGIDIRGGGGEAHHGHGVATVAATGAGTGAGAASGSGIYVHGNKDYELKGKIGGGEAGMGASRTYSFGLGGSHGGIGLSSSSSFHGGNHGGDKWRSRATGGAAANHKGLVTVKTTTVTHHHQATPVVVKTPGLGFSIGVGHLGGHGGLMSIGDDGGIFGKGFKLFN